MMCKRNFLLLLVLFYGGSSARDSVHAQQQDNGYCIDIVE